MGGCCRRDYERFFSRSLASRLAGRYRKRGLDKTSRRMVDFLRDRGVEGSTIVEIGGGVGEIQIELLKAGAAHVTNLELSATYEEDAHALAREAGVAERIDRRLHNIAEEPASVESADVVVLHRVVCCYGDYRRLLSSAADHVGEVLIFSYPPHNMVVRTFYVCFNFVMRLARCSFRGYSHPPEAMRTVLEEHGLHRTYEYRGSVWRIAAHERLDPRPESPA
jgi:magnesium-protoporphyrin O-methyltransferase